MKRKCMAVIAAVILSIMMLAACADPFDDGGNGDVEGRITIRVGVLNEQGEKSLMSTFKREFEKINNEINIVISPFPGDFAAAMTAYVRKPSDFPDIVWMPGDQHAPFSAAGNFVDLSAFFERDGVKTEDYYPSVIETTHYSPTDTGIWFAPRDYNKPVTYINKTMFQKAGVEIPAASEWNMAKFYEVCNALRMKMDDTNNSDDQKLAGLISSSYPVDADLAWNPVTYSFVEHYGGKFFDSTAESATAAVTVDAENTMDAYKNIYTNLLKPKYCSSNDTTDSFLSKGSAMWFSVRPRLQAIINAGIDVDFLPMPTDKIGAGCSGYGIASVAQDRIDTTSIEGNTKTNAELAWEFLKWLISRDGQEVFGSTGSCVPALISLKDNGTWLQYKNASLNHAAFTAKSDADIPVNQVYIFKPAAHISVGKELSNIIHTLGNSASWSGSPLAEPPVTPGNYNTLTGRIATHKAKIVDFVK